MSETKTFPRGSRVFRRLFGAVMCVAPLAVVSAPAQAGPTIPTDIWGLSGDPNQCVGIDNLSDPVGGLVAITSQVAPEEDVLITPSGTVDPLTGRITVEVPSEFFAFEGDESGGLYGFYMMSVEFVEDCDSLEPAEREVCFTTSPDVWWLIPISGSQTFLIYFLAPGESSLQIDMTEDLSSCADDSVPDDPEELEEFEEALELLTIEGESRIRPQYGRGLDLDHYLNRAASSRSDLPDTL